MAKEVNLLWNQTNGVEWVGRAGDMCALGQVGNGERGGGVEVLSCEVAGEGVGDFHSQPIQSNNVVTLNLEIGTS